MKLFLSFLFLLLNAGTAFANLATAQQYLTTGDLVDVQIFIESQCPFCTMFLSQQLAPAWDQGIDQVANVSIVPYGNAQSRANGTAVDPESGRQVNDNKFTCQHGVKECIENQFMLCGMEQLSKGGASYIPFVICAQMKKIDDAKDCATRNGLDFSQLRACAFNAHGRFLHYVAGMVTGGLTPPLRGVPTILLNGAKQPLAQVCLRNAVCSLYKGPNQPYCS